MRLRVAVIVRHLQDLVAMKMGLAEMFFIRK